VNDRQSDFSERLERYLAGDMQERERREFENAILDNPDLATALYSDVQLQTAVAKAREANRGGRILPEEARARGELPDAAGRERGPDVGARTPQTRHGRRWWQLPSLRWAVPAVAVVAMVSWVVFVQRGPGDDVFRGGDKAFEALAPVGDVDNVPTHFAWTQHPDASQYRFALFDAESHVLHSLVTSDSVAVVDTGNVVVPLRGYWTVTPLGETMTAISPEILAWYDVRR
jgi:hypothetical protein